jgi:hypothetical protein
MSLFVDLFRLFFQESPGLLTSKQTREKRSTILECLQGRGSTSNGDGSSSNKDQQHRAYDNDNIDLWELRELALSPGGLLDVSIRKRAWPILTSCHMAVLDGSTAAPHRSVSLSQSDLRSLKHDVKQTVWDVTESLHRKATNTYVRQDNGQSIDASIASNASVKRHHRRVSFSVDQGLNTCVIINEDDEADSMPPIRLSPTDTSVDEADEMNAGTITTATSCHNFSAVTDTGTSFVSHETSSSSAGRRVRWRKASKFEQKIVANVITSVLRTPAQEHASYTDDRFHYYSGLHNLTAILLANLESPSLTSLVLYVD